MHRKFYLTDPALAAQNLLGKVLVRAVDEKVLSGRIVETEAYYGEKDPASRAYTGIKNFNRPMCEEVGHAFIYMVHASWLLNIVAHPENEVGAVLIRAIEPLQGIEEMKQSRRVNKLIDLTNGPGKLTRALRITHEINKADVTSSRSRLFICADSRSEKANDEFKILTTHRIGVSRDLDAELRFYIEGNPFVSKAKSKKSGPVGI